MKAPPPKAQRKRFSFDFCFPSIVGILQRNVSVLSKIVNINRSHRLRTPGLRFINKNAERISSTLCVLFYSIADLRSCRSLSGSAFADNNVFYRHAAVLSAFAEFQSAFSRISVNLQKSAVDNRSPRISGLNPHCSSADAVFSFE